MTQPQENTSSSEFLPPPLIPTDIDNPHDSAAPADERAQTVPETKPQAWPETQADAAQPLAAAAPAERLPQESTAQDDDSAEQTGSQAPNAAANPDKAAEQTETHIKDTAEQSDNTVQVAAVDNDKTAEQSDCSSAGETAAAPAEAAEDEHFPTADEIRRAIYDVVDPEINISIIDLGLVYDIIPNPEDRTVHINMTLTSPGCPLGPEITAAVYLKVTRIPGVRDCQVDLVWSPMWDPTVNPTEETRMALGIW